MKQFFFLLFFSIAAFAAGPVSYYGEFKTDGALLKGSKTGKSMQVKGVSFFWSQWDVGYNFYNENAVDRMAEGWKAEIVRAAYGASSSTDPEFISTNMERMETIIEAAVKNDIYVILDWHSHSAHLEAERERAKEFFAYFAEKYGHLDNIIFELYNEPICSDGGNSPCGNRPGGTPSTFTTWAEIKNYAEAIIPVIREHSDNLILVGTPQWCQKIETVIGNAIDDPNVGYVLHFYAASHSLSTYRSNITSTQGASLPVFVTEFGTTNADGGNPNEGNYGSHSDSRTKEWLDFLNQRAISYVAWSITDKYEGSAFFGVDNEEFDQTNPENWTNPELLTKSGNYIMNMLHSSYETAPWNPTSPVLVSGKWSVVNGENSQFYSLKGVPMGAIKPTTPGIYIEKNEKNIRKIVVQ